MDRLTPTEHTIIIPVTKMTVLAFDKIGTPFTVRLSLFSPLLIACHQINQDVQLLEPVAVSHELRERQTRAGSDRREKI